MGFISSYTSTYNRYESNLAKNLGLAEVDRIILQKLNSNYDLFLIEIKENNETRVMEIWDEMLDILSVPELDPDRSLTYNQIKAQYAPQTLGPNDSPIFAGLTVNGSIDCSGLTCTGEIFTGEGVVLSPTTRVYSRNGNDVAVEGNSFKVVNGANVLDIAPTGVDGFEISMGQFNLSFTGDGSVLVRNSQGNSAVFSLEGLTLNGWDLYTIAGGLLLKIAGSGDAYYFKNNGALTMFDTTSSSESAIGFDEGMYTNDKPVSGIKNIGFYAGAKLYQDGNELKVDFGGQIYKLDKTLVP